MKNLESSEIAAYSDRKIIARSLIYVLCKDRSSGAPVEFGFWNGLEDVTVDVRDGLTLEIEARNFNAKGAVLKVGDISLSDTLNVSAVQVSLSNLNATVEAALRTYDIRNAPIQIYRGLFSPADPTQLVAPARCRFVGYVDTAPINTGGEGGDSSAILNCVSCTRELTRKNAELRSDESQQRRSAGDRFFEHAGATGQVQVFWGQERGI